MGGGFGGRILNHTPIQWGAAQGFDQLPLDTPAGQTVPGVSPTEVALNEFTNAANAGDQPLDEQHRLDYENRQGKYDDAERKFAASEEEAQGQMQGVAQQSQDQMAQMIPQLVSGLAGSVGGLIGGLISPFAQMSQQLMQAGTQALQQGLSAAQSAGSEPLTDEQLLGDDALTDPLAEDGGGTGGGAGGGSGGGTEPTAFLGAPVAGATFPSSAPTLKGALPATITSAGPTMMGGMGGMPMIPPGAMGGGNQQQDQKPDTKRVTAPPIKNGAPVQGRLTTPSLPPVTKLIEGKPVATRRSSNTETEEAKAEEPKAQ